jgi:hypothetical protein
MFVSIRGNCRPILELLVCPDREFYPVGVGSTLFPAPRQAAARYDEDGGNGCGRRYFFLALVHSE